MVQSDMPQSRNGKPKQVITTILKDLDRLRAGSTIKVPLTELAESKEKVRSPLSRATREASRKVARLNGERTFSLDSANSVSGTELAESKEKVRSPLSRATREASRKVATASDTSYLL